MKYQTGSVYDFYYNVFRILHCTYLCILSSVIQSSLSQSFTVSFKFSLMNPFYSIVLQ